MKYCKKCLMPDTRPNIKFIDGVCAACINFEKQKTTNWDERWKELEKVCDTYRGNNENDYDSFKDSVEENKELLKTLSTGFNEIKSDGKARYCGISVGIHYLAVLISSASMASSEVKEEYMMMYGTFISTVFSYFPIILYCSWITYTTWGF